MITVGGGSVVAHCAAGQTTLETWSPNPGFSADVEERGPGRSASVEFESDDAEYEIEVPSDASGRPLARTTGDDDRGD